MTREFVLGIDCKMFVMPFNTRTNTPPTQNYTRADASGYSELQTVQDVTLNLTASTADLTNRKSNGWRQIVSALKEASVDFSVLWQPDDSLFGELLDSYISQCPLAYLVLDGWKEGYRSDCVSPDDDADPSCQLRCGEYGLVTGLHADMVVTSFTRNESLEEGVTADVTIEPAVGLIYPEWVELETFTVP